MEKSHCNFISNTCAILTIISHNVCWERGLLQGRAIAEPTEMEYRCYQYYDLDEMASQNVFKKGQILTPWVRIKIQIHITSFYVSDIIQTFDTSNIIKWSSRNTSVIVLKVIKCLNPP